ncbi:hypothetical protein O181_116505 [Austropuccinia psidii MF-1]|uniref:Uncharacterized protein n=1 Tax=Austropuccinia psidii MF-1 TaxID=1389203 RepID=A0A9Q3KCJ8_9BASI|nr:hypothetical protein [Austropuccinia psidii MF-1]
MTGLGPQIPRKDPPKQSTQERLNFLLDFMPENIPRVPIELLKSKNLEHNHDATKNIMEHPAFRKFNEQETSQISQISESLLIPRQIQAQLCSQRESDRPLILQDIYNQVKKIKKDNLKGRKPIDSLIDTLKEEKFVWSSERDAVGNITPLFFTHPLAIKLLHEFPNVILMDFNYKTNKYKIPLFSYY